MGVVVTKERETAAILVDTGIVLGSSSKYRQGMAAIRGGAASDSVTKIQGKFQGCVCSSFD